jgi:hypothetical protein
MRSGLGSEYKKGLFGKGELVLRILAISHLFPNISNRHFGIFSALGMDGIPAAMLFVFFMIMMMFTVKRIPLDWGNYTPEQC